MPLGSTNAWKGDRRMTMSAGFTETIPASWETSARIYDYRQAANPIRSGLTEPIPDHRWSPPPLEGAGSILMPLDLSQELGCPGPATSPALAAHYVRLAAGDPLRAEAAATSSLFYVMAGRGRMVFPGQATPWSQPREWGRGDVFVLPHGFSPELVAEEPSLVYWVHDGPSCGIWVPRRRGPGFRPASTRRLGWSRSWSGFWAIPPPPGATASVCFWPMPTSLPAEP